MESNSQFIQGDNVFIPHPTKDYKTFKHDIVGGEVNVLHYSDGTVLVHVAQTGKQPATWINRNVEIDAATNTAKIIPGNL